MTHRCGWITYSGKQCGRWANRLWPESDVFYPEIGFEVGIPFCGQHWKKFQSAFKDDKMKRTIRQRRTAWYKDPTYVYLILNPDTNLVKIGKSKEPEKRMKTLSTQTGSPLEMLGTLMPSTPGEDLESKLHHRFAGYRVRGEWFHPVPEILQVFLNPLVESQTT